jgi:hypothetical protein
MPVATMRTAIAPTGMAMPYPAATPLRNVLTG